MERNDYRQQQECEEQQQYEDWLALWQEYEPIARDYPSILDCAMQGD